MLRVLSALLSITPFASAVCPSGGSKPAYAKDAPSAFIPFSNNNRRAPSCSFPEQAPSLSFVVTTKWNDGIHVYSTTMDTGSTGVAISAASLGLRGTDFDKGAPYGNEYLSSSGVFWEGYWVPANMIFPGNVITEQPILAVVNQSNCKKNWDPINGKCNKREHLIKWVENVQYVGVGFGRWSTEQPQACPDKVPFLNVRSIGGEDVAGQIHRGYVITGTGVAVGLTQDNTNHFKTSKLHRNTKSACHSSPTTDWLMVNMSIAVNDTSRRNVGEALFDTGIDQAYITVDDNIYRDVKPHFEPHSNLLPEGTLVDVVVGDESPIAHYAVKVNDSSSLLNPSKGRFYVSNRTAKSVHGPFINTGRFFYKGYDVLFDAECGLFGLREIEHKKLGEAPDSFTRNQVPLYTE